MSLAVNLASQPGPRLSSPVWRGRDCDSDVTLSSARWSPRACPLGRQRAGQLQDGDAVAASCDSVPRGSPGEFPTPAPAGGSSPQSSHPGPRPQLWPPALSPEDPLPVGLVLTTSVHSLCLSALPVREASCSHGHCRLLGSFFFTFSITL